MSRQKLDEAMGFLQIALKGNATHPQANLMAGQIERSRGRIPEATKYFETVLQVNPRIVAANLAMAELSLSRGDPEAAGRYARTALKEDPRSPLALVLVGNLAVQQKKADEAIGHFRKALDGNPNLVMAYLGLGYAYQQKGQRAQAIQAYRKAVELAPKEAAAHNNLAWILADEKASQDEALRHAQQALTLQPGNGRILDTLGWVYYHQGKYAEAEKQFRSASEALPRVAVIQYHLGLVAHKQGRTVEAVTALKRALLMEPNFEEAAAARKLVAGAGGVGDGGVSCDPWSPLSLVRDSGC